MGGLEDVGDKREGSRFCIKTSLLTKVAASGGRGTSY